MTLKNYRLIQNFVSWIDKGEALIVEGVNFKELNRYIAAHVYLYYRYHKSV